MKKKKEKDRPRAAEPLPRFPNCEYMDLLDQVMELHDSIIRAGGVAAVPREIGQMFRDLQLYRDINESWSPPAAGLIAVLDAFAALPADVQRRALGGWAYKPKRPNLVEMTELSGNTIVPVLCIEPGRDWRSSAAGASVEHQVYNGISNVWLYIRRGTSRGEAINLLLHAIEAIERAWPQMIADELWDKRPAELPEADWEVRLREGTTRWPAEEVQHER